jgi:hypothetical protein
MWLAFRRFISKVGFRGLSNLFFGKVITLLKIVLRHLIDISGILKDAYLVLRGKLCRAVTEGPHKQDRFSWTLVDDEEHKNVYLDCPKRDTKITGLDADIFVVGDKRQAACIRAIQVSYLSDVAT